MIILFDICIVKSKQHKMKKLPLLPHVFQKLGFILIVYGYASVNTDTHELYPKVYRTYQLR